MLSYFSESPLLLLSLLLGFLCWLFFCPLAPSIVDNLLNSILRFLFSPLSLFDDRFNIYGFTENFQFNIFLYLLCFFHRGTSLVAQTVKHLPAIRETWVQFLGQEDPLEKEMAPPLQYSCLENPLNRGAWQATVHGVAKVRHDLATKPPPLMDRAVRYFYFVKILLRLQMGWERLL